MIVYMAKDPETARIGAQDRPFTRIDFPVGLDGEGWEQRQCEVKDETWAEMLEGKIAPPAQDWLHRYWWDGVS